MQADADRYRRRTGGSSHLRLTPPRCAHGDARQLRAGRRRYGAQARQAQTAVGYRPPRRAFTRSASAKARPAPTRMPRSSSSPCCRRSMGSRSISRISTADLKAGPAGRQTAAAIAGFDQCGDARSTAAIRSSRQLRSPEDARVAEVRCAAPSRFSLGRTRGLRRFVFGGDGGGSRRPVARPGRSGRRDRRGLPA